VTTTYGSDLFTGTNWQTLQSHTANAGGPWVKHATAGGNWYIYGNRALCRTAGIAYLSGVSPASADYTVKADLRVFGGSGDTGVAGRINTGNSTFYYLYAKGSTELVLAKMVSGAITSLDYYILGGLWDAGSTYTIELEMDGTDIKGYLDGVERVGVVDSSITSTGKGGIRAPVISDTTTGKHLDNFSIFDATVAAIGRSSVVGLIGL
jgi:hypothetical protein